MFINNLNNIENFFKKYNYKYFKFLFTKNNTILTEDDLN